MSAQISVSAVLEQDSVEGVDTTEWLVRALIDQLVRIQSAIIIV